MCHELAFARSPQPWRSQTPSFFCHQAISTPYRVTFAKLGHVEAAEIEDGVWRAVQLPALAPRLPSHLPWLYILTWLVKEKVRWLQWIIRSF